VPALASGPPARAPRVAALPEAASPEATRRPEADTRAEDRGSPRRRVSHPGTRAPALPHCPHSPRRVCRCCPRSGPLPLLESKPRRENRQVFKVPGGPVRAKLGRRGAPLEAASSSTLHPCRCGTSLLTHSLDHQRARHAAHSFFPGRSSLEKELPRRLPPSTAAGRFSTPNSGTNLS
jgi:hypothetical protein